jgi:ATP-dependent DNA ligase
MNVSLYSRQGKSDKVYTIEIRPEGGGHVVYATYGARLGHMTTIPKTKPVPLAQAQAVFARLRKEKEDGPDHYREGEASYAVQVEEPAAALGLSHRAAVPHHMLLKDISAEEAAALTVHEGWMLQPKFDGIRLRLSKAGNVVQGFSRTDKSKTLPQAVVDEAKRFKQDLLLDGELVGETYISFDVLLDGGQEIWKLPAEFRAGYLSTLFAKDGVNGLLRWSSIVPVVTAFTLKEKQTLYRTAHGAGMEGLVFKMKDKPYTAGRGGEGVKYKFVKTCSVIVGDQRQAADGSDKSSFEMYLADGTYIGAVTVPPNKTVPRKGTIAEVRYLYRGAEDGHLVQAVFLCTREDVPRKACTAEQLQVKGAKRA